MATVTRLPRYRTRSHRQRPRRLVPRPDQPDQRRPHPRRRPPYLHAHLLTRISAAPDPDELAFIGASRRVVLDLREATSDLGLNLGDASLTTNDRHCQRRVSNRVFRLVRLT